MKTSADLLLLLLPAVSGWLQVKRANEWASGGRCVQKVPKILNRILDYFIFCWHLYARRKSHWFLIVQYFNLPLLLLPSIILRVFARKTFRPSISLFAHYSRSCPLFAVSGGSVMPFFFCSLSLHFNETEEHFSCSERGYNGGKHSANASVVHVYVCGMFADACIGIAILISFY